LLNGTGTPTSLYVDPITPKASIVRSAIVSRTLALSGFAKQHWLRLPPLPLPLHHHAYAKLLRHR
jgi:hypothetical protein